MGMTELGTRPWTSWAAPATGTRTSISRSKLQGHLTADIQADFKRVGLELKRKVKGSRAIAVARAGDLEWVDPVVGGRMRHQFASGSEFNLEGDVGGFGAGSEFSWQAVATYGFDVNVFNTTMRSVVGYRALSVDYSQTARTEGAVSTGSSTDRSWAWPSAGSSSKPTRPMGVPLGESAGVYLKELLEYPPQFKIGFMSTTRRSTILVPRRWE